jgi:snoRNA binding domain, fibrillarin
VGTALLLGNGSHVALLELPPAGPGATFPLGPGLSAGAIRFLTLPTGGFPPPLLEAARRLPEGTRLVVADPRWQAALAVGAGRPVTVATDSEVRTGRAELDRHLAPDDRPFYLALAERTLERALAAPEEVLISLAREEERLERALGREARAADAFVSVPGTVLAEYRPAWEEARAALARHHAGLVDLMDRTARDVTPNLAEVVGERVAARLVAAAGSVNALSRMSSSRIQLLGSRRRPSPERGPRYGVLFRGVRMNDLPIARRGAYARTLASLAAIAVRADATTRAPIAPKLVARRDRRVEALRRRVR